MADESALTEAENQFFETGGEDAPEEQPEKIREEIEEESAQEVDPPSSEQPAEEPEKEKTVPYGALHEERMRRKEAAEETAAMRERMARMEERFQQVVQKQEAAPEIVSFEEDPAEHLRQKGEMLERKQAEIAEQTRLATEAQQAQQQQNAVVNQYHASAAQYAQTNEHFPAAYQHLVQGRIAEYKAAGHTDAEAVQFVQQDELAIAQKAFQDGVNPAERIYALAETRGFKPEATKESGAEEIDRIEKGQKASRSLSNGRGKAEPPATLEALAEMDDDEFDEKWDEIIGTRKSVLG